MINSRIRVSRVIAYRLDRRPAGIAAAILPLRNSYGRGFNLDGRIQSYPLGKHVGSGGALRTLDYDAAGRITRTTNLGPPLGYKLSQQYVYDGLDRLISVDGSTRNQRFQYDANGNRTQATFGANTYVNAISSTSNRLSSTTGPAPARQNSFDAAGNITSDGTVQYTYGSDGRLSDVVAGGVATAYRYNGLGQRVVKTSAAGAVHYVYDESGRLLGEYDGAGTAIQETVYLGDLPVAVLKQSPATEATPAALGLYYVYADHLSTPRVLTRASDNKMVWRWDSADPFGIDQPDENPSRLGVFTYNPRFPGQVFDKETNNHYNYYRDYDPQTGRYIQSDPIGLAGGMNTYAYVAGNPLSFTDPTGLCPWCIGAGIGAAVEMGMQAYSNYQDGCDMLDMGNYNFGNIGIAAIGGAFAPGLLNVGKTMVRGAKAMEVLHGQAANTANRAAKIAGRISNHQSQMGTILAAQAAIQGTAMGAKALNGKSNCECKE